MANKLSILMSTALLDARKAFWILVKRKTPSNIANVAPISKIHLPLSRLNSADVCAGSMSELFVESILMAVVAKTIACDVEFVGFVVEFVLPSVTSSK